MFHVYDGTEDVEALAKQAIAANQNGGPIETDADAEVGATTFRERVFVFFSLEDNQLFRENPNLFLTAALYQLLNILMITLAILVLIIDSAPTYWDRAASDKLGLVIVEAVTIAFFIFDYVVRLVSAPNVLRFVINPLNILDAVVIIPYFITLGVELGASVPVPALGVVNVLKLFRLVRILRLLRFGKSSGVLVALWIGVKKATDAMLVMVLFFIFAMVLSSTLLFFSEQTVSSFSNVTSTWTYTIDGSLTPFQSIYGTFWWALITMSFVGEGTVAPRSPLGQAVAAMTIILGVASFVLPVALVIRSVVVEVNRFKDVRKAQSYYEMKPAELLMEVLRMSQETNEKLRELKRTQRTLGLLLYKLGQSVTRDNTLNAPVRDGRFSATSLNFSGAQEDEGSDDL
jgi:voltage-gated potassium channel